MKSGIRASSWLISPSGIELHNGLPGVPLRRPDATSHCDQDVLSQRFDRFGSLNTLAQVDWRWNRPRWGTGLPELDGKQA